VILCEVGRALSVWRTRCVRRTARNSAAIERPERAASSAISFRSGLGRRVETTTSSRSSISKGSPRVVRRSKGRPEPLKKRPARCEPICGRSNPALLKAYHPVQIARTPSTP
jgi:hypothetical protein